MVWAIAKLILLTGAFLVLGHLLYRVLARYAAVRRVALSWHIMLLLGATFIFVIQDVRGGPGWTVPLLSSENETVVNTFVGVTIFFGVLFVLRLLDNLFVGPVLVERKAIHISALARHIAVVIILAATILTVLAAYGVPIGPFLATSAIGTAIIGLALQDVLGNVIAGIALQAERPFRVGDWVQIGDIEGKVIETNWRATVLWTLTCDHVVLPNSLVSRERIRNFSVPTDVEGRYAHVGVEYGAPPGRVKAVLMEAAQGADGVLANPKPKVRLTNYGDFAITYEIKYWIDRFTDRDDIQDALMTRIWYLFRRNRITIPFPIRNVFHHPAPIQEPRPALERGSDEVKVLLRGVALLKPLNDEELDSVSQWLDVALFNSGEVLVRQGQPGDSFFIVVSGKVSVRVDGQEVSTLSDHDHFGEMSLLTGEPRAATIIAMTDTQVLIIDRQCFESVLRANPGVADELSKELERIHAENFARLQARGAVPAGPAPTAHSILGAVLRFFNLHR